MAKIKKIRLWADAPEDTDVDHYNWYWDSPDTDLLSVINDVNPDAETDNPEFFIDETGLFNLSDGTYQFFITAVDIAGNESDPYQHPAWAMVTIDVIAPKSPSGGGLERL